MARFTSEGYDAAQICVQGHVINAYSATQPAQNQKFCSQCGERAISECPECNTPIRGKFHSPGLIDATRLRRPAYCHECGKPYPWTSEQLLAVQELVAEAEDVDPSDKAIFAANVGTILKDSPSAELAATRIKRILTKVKGPMAETMRRIVVDIASETAKKVILGR